MTLTLFWLYLKTRISTPCLTLTHGIPMAPTRNHTSMLSYLYGRPTTRRSGSLIPRSRLPKSRNSHYPLMDRPFVGILASTRGSSQRCRTFAPNPSSFFITKFQNENYSDKFLPSTKNHKRRSPSSRFGFRIFTANSPRMSPHTTF